MTVAAALLAAGAGTRFAGDGHKLASQIDGRSLFGRSLASMLEAELDAAAVVTGALDVSHQMTDELGHASVAFVHNPQWETGIASSVRLAARWAAAEGHDAIVVGLADQPFVHASAWRAVAAGSAPICVATYQGDLGDSVRGNPVRLARAVWPLLRADGDEGARALMRRMPEIVAQIACEGRPDDIDTVEDLRRWS